jgi:hypothetical protein
MRRLPGIPEADAILEVTGVSASEILHRCANLRVTGVAAPLRPYSGWPPATGSGRETWRLIDFAEGSDEEFVQAAYASLLCRLPSGEELTRCIADLRAGSSRFDVLMRLTLSAEGRRARERRVSGIALPALVAAGHAIELGSRVRRGLTPLTRVMRRMDLASRREREASRKRLW